MSAVNDADVPPSTVADVDDIDQDVPVWCPEGYLGGMNNYNQDHTLWYGIEALSPGQELESGLDEARIYYWVDMPIPDETNPLQGFFIQHEFFESLNNQAKAMNDKDRAIPTKWKKWQDTKKLAKDWWPAGQAIRFRDTYGFFRQTPLENNGPNVRQLWSSVATAEHKRNGPPLSKEDNNPVAILYGTLRKAYPTGEPKGDFQLQTGRHPWAQSVKGNGQWQWCPLVTPTGLDQPYVYVDLGIPNNAHSFYVHFDVYTALQGINGKSLVTGLPARRTTDGAFLMKEFDGGPETVDEVKRYIERGLEQGSWNTTARYSDSSKIEATLVPQLPLGSGTPESLEACKSLKARVNRALQKYAKNQTFAMTVNVADKPPPDSVPLHFRCDEDGKPVALPDPFDTFLTFVSPATMKLWLDHFPPRSPPTQKCLGALQAFLRLQSAGDEKDPKRIKTEKVSDQLVGTLSDAYMRNVKGLRKHPGVETADEGKDAWGYSTSELVKKGGFWTPSADDKVPSIYLDKKLVWKMNLYESEWLHRIAFSFGAFGGLHLNSGKKGNFLLGTSEANSLMTYYERAVQDFVRTESALRRKLEKPAATGRITTDAQYTQYWQRTGTDEYKLVPEELPGSNQLKGLPAWLRLTLGWKAVFPVREGVTGGTDDWATKCLLTGRDFNLSREFNLFDRLFFTKIEHLLAREFVETAFQEAPDRLAKQPQDNAVAVLNTKLARLALAPVPSGPALTADHGKTWSAIVDQASRVATSSAVVREPFLAGFQSPQSTPPSGHPLLVGKAPELLVQQLQTPAAPAKEGPAAVNPAPKESGPASPNPTEVAPTAAATPPAGFILGGSIKLFNLIDATLYQFQHSGSFFNPDFQYSIVALNNTISLGSMVPSLAASPFNAVQIHDARFTYLNMFLDDKTMPGLSLAADIVFDGALEEINTLLTDIFHQKDPRIHMVASLGYDFDISKSFTPGAFTLSGSLADISVKAGSGSFYVELKELGIDLMAQPCMKMGRDNQWTHSYLLDYAFYGTALIGVPGSVAPLLVAYRVTATDSDLLLSIWTSAPWVDAGGVAGLTLQEVSFTMQLPKSGAGDAFTKHLALHASATIMLDSSCISLDGSYSPDGLMLEATLQNFTLDDLAEIFNSISGGEDFAALQGHDVTFDNISVTMTTGAKASLTLEGQVTISGYTSASAIITVDSTGVTIRGDISDIHVGDVTIQQAQLHIDLHKASSGLPSSFLIAGQFHVLGLDVSVGLTISEAAAGGSAARWAVYGEIDGDMHTSKIAPFLSKVPEIDLVLSKIAVIASSDDASGNSIVANKFQYPVRKGIQLCATIEKIGLIDDLLGGSNSGFIFTCSVSSGGVQDLLIQFPGARSFNLGSGLTTGPLGLEIQAAEGATLPRLMLEASLNVPVPDQPDPLVFTLGLALGPNSAEGSAEMKGWWNNPFGLSKQVSIGPVLAIALELQYGEGLPSSIAFEGGLKVGSKVLDIAFKIGDQPLLKASTNKLSISDLISFAGDIAGVRLPSVPDDLLAIQDVDFYISSGVFLGDQFFPAGASFKGSVVLFGKGATVSAQVGQTIDIKASMDGLSLGPLSIQGASGPNPSGQVQISPTTQHVAIDGYVDFCSLDKQKISINADLLPSLQFRFSMATTFADMLRFELEGKMLGTASFSDLSSLDFALSATLQQDILDYIATQANLQFAVIKHAIDKGISDAKAKLSDAQKRFDDQLQAAQATLDSAQVAYDKASGDAQEKLAQAKNDAAAQKAKLQAAIDAATAGYSADVAAAQNKLEAAKDAAAASIKRAQDGVTAVTLSDATLSGANKAAQDAKDAMQSKFGSALKSIADAQGRINDLNDKLDSVDKGIQEEESKAKAPIALVTRSLWSFNPSSWVPSIPSIPSVPGIDWSKIDPSKVDWSTVDLSKVNWSQVDPQKIDWSKVDPSRMPWGQLDPSKVDWNKIDLSKVNWSEIDPQKMDWSKVDPAKIPWGKLDPGLVDWSKMDMTRVDWSKVDPTKVDWSKVDPTKVDWSKVDPKALPWPNPETEADRLAAIAKLPGLYTTKAALLASLEVVKQALDLASAVLTTADYISAKALVDSTANAVGLAMQANNRALGTAMRALSEAQLAATASINAAQQSVDATKAAKQAVIDTAKASLATYTATATATITAAQAAVDASKQTAEYATFKAASTALAAAKTNTADLDLAKRALDIADAAATGALDLTHWAAVNAGKFINVRSVVLSGNLRALVLGLENAVASDVGKLAAGKALPAPAQDMSTVGTNDLPALTAHVSGTVIGHDFSVDFKFRPGQANRFITDIVQTLWQDLRGALALS